VTDSEPSSARRAGPRAAPGNAPLTAQTHGRARAQPRRGRRVRGRARRGRRGPRGDPEPDAAAEVVEAEHPEELSDEGFAELEDEVDELAGRARGAGPPAPPAAAERAPARRARRRPRGADGRRARRFLAFLRASWAELQRVQWPDRRQVAQATAVVIGFVIVAGLYLGLADKVAQKVVDFIL
jgi:preprotein translocase SecE subunit